MANRGQSKSHVPGNLPLYLFSDSAYLLKRREFDGTRRCRDKQEYRAGSMNGASGKTFPQFVAKREQWALAFRLDAILKALT